MARRTGKLLFLAAIPSLILGLAKGDVPSSETQVEASRPSTTNSPPARENASAGGELGKERIFARARAAYDSLATYSDEGKVVSTLNGLTLTTTFKIKLARPNLYRIEWVQTNESASSTTTTKPQSVWSAGNGDFLDMLGHGPQKQASQEMALAGATGISGGAAATIPGVFFKTRWGNPLTSVEQNNTQQADEKVGDVDCYVFSSNFLKGTTTTLLIGKQDYLIHQIRRLTSAEAIKAALAEDAKADPSVVARLATFVPHDTTSTETHSNIVLNTQLAATDFAQ